MDNGKGKCMYKPLIIGHRGSRCHYPENTLPAYKYAVEINVDMVDVDVVVTKDKVLLVYHDLVINPDILCDLSGNYLARSKKEFRNKLAESGEIDKYLIKNLTLAELQSLYEVKLNRNSSYAKFFPEQQNVPNTRLSSLQEVVDYVNNLMRSSETQSASLFNKMDPRRSHYDSCRQMPTNSTNSTMSFQVEIKNDLEHPEYSYSYQELALLLYAFIIKNNLVERIKIQAFDWRILIELNRLEPKIKTAYLVAYDFKNNWQSWFHCSEVLQKANIFMRTNGASVNINALDDFNHGANILYLIKALGGYSYEPEDSELVEAEVILAHSLGLKVFVWTWPEHSGFVINESLVKQLYSWQIDGFITDDPLLLFNILKRLG